MKNEWSNVSRANGGQQIHVEAALHEQPSERGGKEPVSSLPTLEGVRTRPAQLGRGHKQRHVERSWVRLQPAQTVYLGADLTCAP